jgi:hypothetical protein
MNVVARLFPRRARNQVFLHRLRDEVGKEIEAWPYGTLSRPAEEISFTREIDSGTVWFSIEAYERNTVGDIHVCVDVDANLPLFPLASPSYVFWKKLDGTIYY